MYLYDIKNSFIKNSTNIKKTIISKSFIQKYNKVLLHPIRNTYISSFSLNNSWP